MLMVRTFWVSTGSDVDLVETADAHDELSLGLNWLRCLLVRGS